MSGHVHDGERAVAERSVAKVGPWTLFAAQGFGTYVTSTVTLYATVPFNTSLLVTDTFDTESKNLLIVKKKKKTSESKINAHS